MRRLVLLASAVDDLRSTLAYITQESGNRATARAFVEALRGHCRKLARLPGTLGGLGRNCGPTSAAHPIAAM